MPAPSFAFHLDTVHAVWQSCYPAIFRHISGTEVVPEVADALVQHPVVSLDDADITDLVDEIFGKEKDPSVPSYLRLKAPESPAEPPRLTVRTYPSYDTTYTLECTHSKATLWLPCPSKRKGPAPETTAPAPGDWRVTGFEMEAIRLACAEATVSFWISMTSKTDMDTGFAQAVAARLPSIHDLLGLESSSRVPLQSAALNTRVTHFNEPSVFGREPKSHVNPSDGSGYFTHKGFHLTLPPPSPILNGGIQTEHGINGCTEFLSVHAYATPCTCAGQDPRAFSHKKQ